MADSSDARHAKPNQPGTLAEFIEEAKPMGDLSQFAVHDLTPEEENVFYKILGDA